MRKKERLTIDPKQWLDDANIRQLTDTQRAILMDIMCMMWLSERKGCLNESTVMRLYGKECLDTLISQGLLTIHDGWVTSPRMVREAEISAMRAEAGRKGGESTHSHKPKRAAKPTEPTPSKPKEPPKVAQEPTLFPVDQGQPQVPHEKPQTKAAQRMKYTYADDVTLTLDEYQKLCGQFTEPVAKEMIKILSDYKGSSGKRYKSDYKAILNWVVDRYNEKQQRYGRKNSGTTQKGSSEPGSGEFKDDL